MEARDQSPKKKTRASNTDKKVMFSENPERASKDSVNDDADSSKFKNFRKRLMLILVSSFLVYYLSWEVGIIDPTRIGGYIGNVLFIPQQCYCDWKWKCKMDCISHGLEKGNVYHRYCNSDIKYHQK